MAASFFNRCSKKKEPYMKDYDVQKISMNLIFLGENTINTNILIDKLIHYDLMNENDRSRISRLPTYDHNMEVYLTLLKQGAHAFDTLCVCLEETGNSKVLSKINPKTDFLTIWLACKTNWPFTFLFSLTHTLGVLYWILQIHQYFLYHHCSYSNSSSSSSPTSFLSDYQSK